MKRIDRDEDAGDRLERELTEEQQFDALHRRSFLEHLDYKAMHRSELRHEENVAEINRQFGDGMHNRLARRYIAQDEVEAGWFRRVLAANLPRGPDGRANATAAFPVAMSTRLYKYDFPNSRESIYEEAKKRYLRLKKAKEGS